MLNIASQDIIKTIIKSYNSEEEDIEAIEAIESEDNNIASNYFIN